MDLESSRAETIHDVAPGCFVKYVATFPSLCHPPPHHVELSILRGRETLCFKRQDFPSHDKHPCGQAQQCGAVGREIYGALLMAKSLPGPHSIIRLHDRARVGGCSSLVHLSNTNTKKRKKRYSGQHIESFIINTQLGKPASIPARIPYKLAPSSIHSYIHHHHTLLKSPLPTHKRFFRPSTTPTKALDNHIGAVPIPTNTCTYQNNQPIFTRVPLKQQNRSDVSGASRTFHPKPHKNKKGAQNATIPGHTQMHVRPLLHVCRTRRRDQETCNKEKREIEPACFDGRPAAEATTMNQYRT